MRCVTTAVVPIERFRQKFGDLQGSEISQRIALMAEQFLHEAPVAAGIVQARAAVTRRQDAGASAEGLDLDPGVVGDGHHR